MSVLSANEVNSASFSSLPIPRILFVHACPLVEGIATLDYIQEETTIIKCCRKANISIRFKSQVGTVNGFSSSLINGATIIHYSGHGERNSIVLEKDNGDIHYLDSKSLEGLLKAIDTGYMCNVAFVSACHSEEAGKKFIAAGVKHVICVKQSEMVSDESSMNFARLFYEALFQGRSVRVAFDIALQTVLAAETSVSRHIGFSSNSVSSSIQASSSDASRQSAADRVTVNSPVAKYLLLPLDESHDEIIFSNQDIECGIFIDETVRTSKNNCDMPPSKFVTRNTEMQIVYNYLCSSRPRSRLVCVEGDRGVGKTAFVCQLARYITERSMYDEICFLPLHRMQKQYEVSTQGDYQEQLVYLIKQFAKSFSRYQGEDISSIEDLVSFLERKHLSPSMQVHAPVVRSDLLNISSAPRGSLGSLSSSDGRNRTYTDSNESSFYLGSLNDDFSVATILFVLDGCEDFFNQSVEREIYPVDSEIDTENSEASSGAHDDAVALTPLLFIIDSILRRTQSVNFLLTRNKRLYQSSLKSTVTSSIHLSEPVKVVLLKPFTHMKMAELIRKVAPRPFSLPELGLTVATSSQANEILSKKPWILELHGNPRAAIIFVQHLTDIQVNIDDECIALAKKSYEESMAYRYASNITPRHVGTSLDYSLITSSSKKIRSSIISSYQGSEYESKSSIYEPQSHANQSSFIRNTSYSCNMESFHEPTRRPANDMEVNSPTISVNIGSSIASTDWIDNLTKSLFSTIFSSSELQLQSLELRSRLCRQYSDEDRLYLLSVFIGRAAIISSTYPSVSSTYGSGRRNLLLTQDSYKKWWEGVESTIRKFRYEFMCSYPILLYGFCNRQKAEQLLFEENKSGLFLIRFSESRDDGSLVLSSLLPKSPQFTTLSSTVFENESTASTGMKKSIEYDDIKDLSISDPSMGNSSQTNQLRVYHHLLVISDYGISLSFNDRKSTFSSLRQLLENCDNLRVLFPDVPKAEAIKTVDKISLTKTSM